jgi:hypothetical protein
MVSDKSILVSPKKANSLYLTCQLGIILLLKNSGLCLNKPGLS